MDVLILPHRWHLVGTQSCIPHIANQIPKEYVVQPLAKDDQRTWVANL